MNIAAVNKISWYSSVKFTRTGEYSAVMYSVAKKGRNNKAELLNVTVVLSCNLAKLR